MQWLLTFHGEMRWLVMLVALAVAARSTVGLLAGSDFRGADRALMTVFTILLDLNLVMGLILLFSLPGGFPANRLEHGVTMILAIVTAHSSVIWRRSDDSKRKFRNNLIVVVVVLALVLTGVLRLRGGWIF